MATAEKTSGSDLRLQLLAEFRHELRRFLHFSEEAALKLKLHPQQHQLLLQIAGVPRGAKATVAYAAERLGLRHNSVVELCNRSEEAGLITRKQDAGDRRCVVLQTTAKGRRILQDLSEDHARELNDLGPRLVRALRRIQATGKPKRNASAASPVATLVPAARAAMPMAKSTKAKSNNAKSSTAKSTKRMAL